MTLDEVADLVRIWHLNCPTAVTENPIAVDAPQLILFQKDEAGNGGPALYYECRRCGAHFVIGMEIN